MTDSSCSGPNPYSDVLSQNQQFSDVISEGVFASGHKKSPTEIVADHVAEKVYGVANSAIRQLVVGPADIVVGPVLETADDLIPKEVPVPSKNLDLDLTPLGKAILNGFCEETYTMGGGEAPLPLQKEQLPLVQTLRNALHVCARPAEALEEGTSTNATVSMLLDAIRESSPETQQRWHLDTLSANLESKVQGNPKNLLSVLIQGVINMVPEAQRNGPGADPSHVVELLLKDTIPFGNGTIQHGGLISELPKGTRLNPPFTIPEKGLAEFGGEDRSSSLDVILGGPIPLPDLVLNPELPPNDGEIKDPPRPFKSDSSQKKPPHPDDKQPPSSEKKTERPKFFYSPPPEDDGKDLPKDFGKELADRPPDFTRFTGKLSVSGASDPLADEKRLANLWAYYQKYGWPKERIDYELKVRGNKVAHRDAKLSDIDLDIRINSQRARVKQAVAKKQQAEELHVKTGNNAVRVSEATVDYIVEFESLNRLLEQSKQQTVRAEKESAAQSADAPQAAGSNQPKTPTAAEIQDLETQIQDIDAKIAAADKAEQRAQKRADRYKKPGRKIVQKILHKVGARKPGTVVEEETILANENHEQKLKLESQKEALLKTLDVAKKSLAEINEQSLRPQKEEVSESPNNSNSGKTDSKGATERQQNNEDEAPKPEQKPAQDDEQGPAPSPESEQKEQSRRESKEGTSPEAKPSEESSLGRLFAPIIKPVKRNQEKLAKCAEKVARAAEEALVEQRELVFEAKDDFAESKDLLQVADFINKQLAQDKDGGNPTAPRGRRIAEIQEQARAVQSLAALKTTLTAADVVAGSAVASATHSVHSAAGRLCKEVKTAGTTTSNTLGSVTGSVVVNFGANCIAQGKLDKNDAIQAAKQVAIQTTKGVATQVAGQVVRSGIKGAVKEISPRLAKTIPGLSTINNVYAVGSAALAADSVGGAIANGANAATDVGISYVCASVGQALLPIPFVGAFVGSVGGSLIIHGKNCFISYLCSDSEKQPKVV